MQRIKRNDIKKRIYLESEVNNMANFIVEFPLKTEKYQEDILNKRFEIGRKIYNSLVNITQVLKILLESIIITIDIQIALLLSKRFMISLILTIKFLKNNI